MDAFTIQMDGLILYHQPFEKYKSTNKKKKKKKKKKKIPC